MNSPAVRDGPPYHAYADPAARDGPPYHACAGSAVRDGPALPLCRKLDNKTCAVTKAGADSQNPASMEFDYAFGNS
jgi:hypothetical protein